MSLQQPTTVEQTRMLLAKALSALDRGERDDAMEALAAATNRLGERTWPEEHPAGRALELINCAIEHVMIDHPDAGELVREALQYCDAVEQEVDQ